jgi:hypothetical protein
MEVLRWFHQNPVFLTQPDVALYLPAPSWSDETSEMIEALIVKERSDGLFEVCCIPFCLDHLALGDVFELIDETEARIVKPSGRIVFRTLGRQFEENESDQLILELNKAGALVEFFRLGTLAIDAADMEIATRVFALLWPLREAKKLAVTVRNREWADFGVVVETNGDTDED